MKNFQNISNLFNQASEAKRIAEEKKASDNLFDTIFEVEWDFRAEMNVSASKIRFIQYKEPDTKRASEISAEIHSLEQEYLELCSKISYKDENAVKMAYDIKKKKYALKQALADERYVGWYITPAGKEFTETELSIIAQTLYQPGKKTSLFSFLYRLGAPLVINWEYVQEDLDKIPNINLHCEQRVEDYQSASIGKHSKVEDLPDNWENTELNNLNEDDSYIDIMDQERESL